MRLSPAAVLQAEGAQGGGGWQWSEAARRRGSCGDSVTTTVDHHRDQRCRTGSCTSARTIRHSGLVFVVEHKFHKKKKKTKKLSSIRSKGSLHPAAAVFFLAKKKEGAWTPVTKSNNFFFILVLRQSASGARDNSNKSALSLSLSS